MSEEDRDASRSHRTAFRYDVKDGRHELHVAGLTTARGLGLLDPRAIVRVTRFGATSYKNYGWATEKELPPFASVQDLRDFLERDGASVGLVELEAEVDGVGRLASHDDGECHFIFVGRAAVMETLKKAGPAEHEGILIDALLNNPGVYITCGDSGILRKYASRDAYLKAEGNTAGKKR